MSMSKVVQDARGRPLQLETPARRIVSLVPSITEALFTLGAGEAVVGVTNFCAEPREEVRTRIKVGGPKTVRCDVVVKLAPDLVIANMEENHKADVDALEKAGLRVLATYPRTVLEGIQLIRDLGVVTGTSRHAEAIAAECEAAHEEIKRFRRRRRPLRVFCAIWRRPYMTISGDTYVSDMLRTCGAENVFREHPKRYPVVALEEIAALQPDVILLPDEPFPFRERHREEFRDLKDVPAVRADRLHLLDGKVLSWYGPRIAVSLRVLTRILHGSER